jgi:16S rRNA (cytosine1402-N4)-methyltransferase
MSSETLMGGMGDALHRSVLLAETIKLLQPERGGLFVDATLGLGGHAEAMLEASESVRVIGIDRDAGAIELARTRLMRFGERFQTAHGDFRDIARIVAEVGGGEKLSGVLADLGVSSWQLDSPERGFSFRFDAPLDMRMNASETEETAAELLAHLPEEEIARIIYEYGEETGSRRIARWIVERRERGEPIKTTSELAELVARAASARGKGKKKSSRRHHHTSSRQIHPATRTFQALRIAVNRELEGLGEFIEGTVDLLQPQGRMCVISFHSLEDRIVKHTFRRLGGQCVCDPRSRQACECGARRVVEILTRRPVTPGEAETRDNPRARSAKLRACARL